VSFVRFLQDLHLFYLSQPASDRPLLRAVRKRKMLRVVELGVGRLERTLRLLELGRRQSDTPLQYTGIDLFEARPQSAAGIPLREAYRQLKSTGAVVRLSPGDPYTALQMIANRLTEVDLVVIAGDQDRASLERAWFYMPRMLAADAAVYLETPGEKTPWRLLTRSEIDALAAKATPARKAA
jgi:hypothetical protein